VRAEYAGSAEATAPGLLPAREPLDITRNRTKTVATLHKGLNRARSGSRRLQGAGIWSAPLRHPSPPGIALKSKTNLRSAVESTKVLKNEPETNPNEPETFRRAARVAVTHCRSVAYKRPMQSRKAIGPILRSKAAAAQRGPGDIDTLRERPVVERRRICRAVRLLAVSLGICLESTHSLLAHCKSSAENGTVVRVVVPARRASVRPSRFRRLLPGSGDA
jgi:hypothetical protein